MKVIADNNRPPRLVSATYFLEPKPVVIVANGEKPSIQFFKQHISKANEVIACDGAFDWLIGQNIIPDIVLGDMDSSLVASSCNITKLIIEDQNSNDLEKALQYCLQHNHFEITILAGFGLRIDHMLTNLFVLKKFSSRMMINMADDNQIAFMCPPNQEIWFDNLVGNYVSFFPLKEEVGPITTTGILYPLKKEMLSLNHRIGTLNTITDQRATLKCQSKDLLVILPNIYAKMDF